MELINIHLQLQELMKVLNLKPLNAYERKISHT